MKKILALLSLLLFLVTTTVAQEDYSAKPDKQNQDEIKTLFRKGKQHKKPVVGFFIGPEFAYTQFTGSKNVLLLGASLGMTFNHWISIGLSGYGIINSGNLKYVQQVWDNFDKKDQSVNLYGGYGGLLLEFQVLPKSPVHVSFPILVGAGGLTYMYRPDYVDHYDWGGYMNVDWDAFFVVQPGVRVELNIVKFFRIGIGASYRYTPNLELPLDKTNDLTINQFNATLSLKFGKF